MAMTQSPTRMIVAVAEGHEGQCVIGRHFQERDVGVGVGADQLCLKLNARAEFDQDLVGAFDHVVVGDDETIFGNDEARAQRLAATWGVFGTLLASRKSLKKSSSGLPGGTSGAGPCRLATTADVVMLTTASPTWSTRSAKDGGAACARACVADTIIAIATRRAINAAIIAR
jgi:hypothetical protein